MAYQDNPFSLPNQLRQHLFSVAVQVVGWLVQKQSLGIHGKTNGQKHFFALTAGKIADSFSFPDSVGQTKPIGDHGKFFLMPLTKHLKQ